jgi:hypothetical protein
MHPLVFALDLWVALAAGADEAPSPDEYTAGWIGFAVIAALAVAVAVLGVSLSRHLRKARDNADRGVFGSQDKPRSPGS